MYNYFWESQEDTMETVSEDTDGMEQSKVMDKAFGDF